MLAAIRPAAAKGDQQSVQELNMHRNLGWILVPLIVLHAFGTRLGVILEHGKAFSDARDLAATAILASSVPKVAIGGSCRGVRRVRGC